MKQYTSARIVLLSVVFTIISINTANARTTATSIQLSNGETVTAQCSPLSGCIGYTPDPNNSEKYIEKNSSTSNGTTSATNTVPAPAPSNSVEPVTTPTALPPPAELTPEEMQIIESGGSVTKDGITYTSDNNTSTPTETSTTPSSTTTQQEVNTKISTGPNETTYIDPDGYKQITTTYPEDGSTLTETIHPDGTSTYTSTNATDGSVNSSASKAQKTNATNTSTDTNNVLGIEAGKLRSGNVDMNTIPTVILSIIKTLLGIAGTVAIFSLIYHAVQMQLNSGITGDSSGVDKAKKGMTGALIGFVIAIAAWFLVTRAVDLLAAMS